MSNVGLPICDHPGCADYGVFPGVDDEGKPLRFCFNHAPLGDDTPLDNAAGTHVDDLGALTPFVDAVATDTADAWHDDVVAGLAAILLDHTAMALDETPDAVERSMRSLAAATDMPTDFAAGLLMATTWIAGVGEVDGLMLSHGADQFEAEAEGGPIAYTLADNVERVHDIIDDADDQRAHYRGDDVDVIVPAYDHLFDGGDTTASDDDTAAVCAWCESPEHTTAQHAEQYPLPDRAAADNKGEPDNGK